MNKSIGILRQFLFAGNSREFIKMNSVVENKDHVNPTPFAQWSVQIMNPDDLDLSGLTDVEFQWPGKAYS